MGDSSIRLKKFERVMRSLFPRGWAWTQIHDTQSNIRALADSLAIEPCRVQERALQFIDEVFPATTLEMLEDWERLLGLPDDCNPNPESQTINQRRLRVIQVLTAIGGQNIAFYKTLVSHFGIDPDSVSIEDVQDFRVGRSRVGDRLTNGDWIFAFIVRADATEAFRFRTGINRVGERLQDASNPVLECLINKHKPAHTYAIFTFGNNI